VGLVGIGFVVQAKEERLFLYTNSEKYQVVLNIDSRKSFVVENAVKRKASTSPLG